MPWSLAYWRSSLGRLTCVLVERVLHMWALLMDRLLVVD
jgi:hypothetical protein